MAQPAGAIYYQMDEEDLRRVLAFEDAMIGSDGLPHDAFPHPRLWGTFPRVLGHYSRHVGLFSLEQAIRRMTAVPASSNENNPPGRFTTRWTKKICAGCWPSKTP